MRYMMNLLPPFSLPIPSPLTLSLSLSVSLSLCLSLCLSLSVSLSFSASLFLSLPLSLCLSLSLSLYLCLPPFPSPSLPFPSITGEGQARARGGRTTHVGARQHSRRAKHNPPLQVPIALCAARVCEKSNSRTRHSTAKCFQSIESVISFPRNGKHNIRLDFVAMPALFSLSRQSCFSLLILILLGSV